MHIALILWYTVVRFDDLMDEFLWKFYQSLGAPLLCQIHSNGFLDREADRCHGQMGEQV